jgi:hypothetical protein
MTYKIYKIFKTNYTLSYLSKILKKNIFFGIFNTNYLNSSIYTTLKKKIFSLGLNVVVIKNKLFIKHISFSNMPQYITKNLIKGNISIIYPKKINYIFSTLFFNDLNAAYLFFCFYNKFFTYNSFFKFVKYAGTNKKKFLTSLIYLLNNSCSNILSLFAKSNIQFVKVIKYSKISI